MAQLFPRSANALARGSVVLLLFLLAGVGAAVFSLARSGYVTRQGLVLEQPVPFSHDHHVGQIGIDCRYCHTAVETTAAAGIPPTATCMNCHNQLWTNAAMLEPVRASFRDGKPLEWNRVHDLPEFTYFNHSIHVAKGVACVTCHGQVDRMPLMYQFATLQMQWCLDCHKDPVPNIRPREEVTNVAWTPPAGFEQEQLRLASLYNVQSKTSCSTCHR
ncbi:MAG: cytochrome c3 family protein [Thermoanaerobaculia bacterium]|nr:MAG: cytochrome c3 family protein [Thermoanaerobaculia bacterium]MBZ0102697.1 cytochrome c family protein [Thermoanaerobaculia bacterium]